MKTKYIMIDDVFPVLFGEYFQHDHVAQRMKDFGEATSAGFVRFAGNGQLHAYGESISLNMKPAEQDSQILNKVFSGVKQP
jgi:hypothetical protein